MMPIQNEKLGLIAGNGKFPFLVLDAARAQGFEVVVAAIKEEAFPEISEHGASSIHWLSLGELSKLIETFQREGVRRAILAALRPAAFVQQMGTPGRQLERGAQILRISAGHGDQAIRAG